MSARRAVAYVLLFGWIGALLASRKTDPREERGRDNYVKIPVRICSDVRDQLIQTKQQTKLKNILSGTPVYAQLLDEYPNATVTVLKR